MLKNFPEKAETLENIMGRLNEYGRNDIKNSRGRLFTYFYDPGINLLDQTSEIFLNFYNRNGMDYHAFPSTLKIENDVIAMMGSLMHGNDNLAGTFTTGGTESIMLAVKSARDKYFENHNGIPEIVMPVTAHPAFGKAAEYLGLKTVILPVNDKYIMDTEELKNSINDNTAMIVASAPSFPYGVIDPVKEASEIAMDKNKWLHVDACVGGMILPFLKDLEIGMEKFDFSLPGVSSISIDLHKYGFTPKGSSVILYKNRELRKHQIYVNARWPGYPMSNSGLQATKSAGPLAGTWAILNFLGRNGYDKLAEKTLKAYRIISKGISSSGFKIVGKPDATIFAFTGDNIFDTGVKMIENGWYPQIQPANVKMDLPPSVHLNICPVHLEVADEFLDTLKAIKNNNHNTDENKLEMLKLKNKYETVDKLVKMIKEDNNKTILFHILRNFDYNTGENIFRIITDEDFTASKN